MPSFDFDQARLERLRERDPITFTLGGETFTCLPFVPLGVAWGIVDAPERAEEDQAKPVDVFRALAELIADSLVPSDVNRWWGIFGRRDDPIDVDCLSEVAQVLTEAYGGRPTSPSTDSSDGRQTNGPGSNSKRSRKDSARSRT